MGGGVYSQILEATRGKRSTLTHTQNCSAGTRIWMVGWEGRGEQVTGGALNGIQAAPQLDTQGHQAGNRNVAPRSPEWPTRQHQIVQT